MIGNRPQVRADGRVPTQLRPVRFELGVQKWAEGSCIVHFGDTRVLCAATIADRVPPHLRGSIEYSAVTQPVPLPRRWGGTRSAIVAAHRTRVSPKWTMHEPSAHFWTPSSKRTGRSCVGTRPSARTWG